MIHTLPNCIETKKMKFDKQISGSDKDFFKHKIGNIFLPISLNMCFRFF